MRRYGVLKKVFQKYKFLNQTNAKPGVHEFVIVLDGLKPDYNVGKIFRGADAFGAKEVILIKVPFFNVFPSRGSFKHVPAKFFETFEEAYQYLKPQGYEFFTMEPEKGTRLWEAKLSQKAAYVFGHEEFGLSFDPTKYENIKALAIPQYGKVQSLNVSVAASLTMYEHVVRSPVLNTNNITGF